MTDCELDDIFLRVAVRQTARNVMDAIEAVSSDHPEFDFYPKHDARKEKTSILAVYDRGGPSEELIFLGYGEATRAKVERVLREFVAKCQAPADDQ